MAHLFLHEAGVETVFDQVSDQRTAQRVEGELICGQRQRRRSPPGCPSARSAPARCASTTNENASTTRCGWPPGTPSTPSPVALGPHYARAEDEAHSLLSEAFSASADLEVIGNQLHVRIEPLSAPRRSRAIASLCTELTATETVYPGTELVLVYGVKGY